MELRATRDALARKLELHLHDGGERGKVSVILLWEGVVGGWLFIK